MEIASIVYYSDKISDDMRGSKDSFHRSQPLTCMKRGNDSLDGYAAVNRRLAIGMQMLCGSILSGLPREPRRLEKSYILKTFVKRAAARICAELRGLSGMIPNGHVIEPTERYLS